MIPRPAKDPRRSQEDARALLQQITSATRMAEIDAMPAEAKRATLMADYDDARTTRRTGR